MTSTTLFSDVVLPAATWYEKHDLNTTDMHPFVHSFNPAIAPPWQTRTDFDAFHPSRRRSAGWPRRTSASARTWSRCRCCTTPPTSWPTRTGVVRDWKAGECDPVPGRDDAEAGRRRARLRRRRRRRWARSGRWSRSSGCHARASRLDAGQGGRLPAAQERGGPRRRGRRAAVAGPRHRTGARRSSRCPAPRTAGWRRQGFQHARGAHRHAAGRPRRRARGQADHLRRHAGPARSR